MCLIRDYVENQYLLCKINALSWLLGYKFIDLPTYMLNLIAYTSAWAEKKL